MNDVEHAVARTPSEQKTVHFIWDLNVKPHFLPDIIRLSVSRISTPNTNCMCDADLLPVAVKR